ncbi:MAG: hypothetical protein IJN88_06140 [Clostridia bacterium]|nr:hypothetical protein [Clostridia bacterium]
MNKKAFNIIICTLACSLVLSGFLLCILLSKETYSDSERRELTSFPEVSVSSLLTGRFMDSFEDYAVDNFPFRDTFRSIKAYFSYYALGQKDNNKIYVHDGYIASMDYPYNKESVDYAASRFGYIYEKYLKDSQVYLSIIPDKNVFLAKEAGVLYFDSAKLVKYMKEAMPYAEYIDIFPTLSIEDYYKTDSHWKQERIEDTAEVLAGGLGTKLSGNRTAVGSSLPFYGVYYGQAALRLEADSITYLTSPAIEKMTAFDGQNSKDIPVYDTDRLNGRDPYETFLSGPLSLVSLENPEADTDRELIIFRDSFTSAIAPLLAEGYRKVTLADIRYINPDYVCSMLDFRNKDVLFLYSTAILNNSETIK